MKKFYFIPLFIFLLPMLPYAQGTWQQKASLPASGRYGAIAFSIGNKGYFGTGYNGSYLNDFWQYDPSTDVWTQKANFGGGPRSFAVGIAIGTKGYIGTGESQNDYALNDWWEYDPSTNTWTQKASLPIGRTRAAAFSLGNYGYVGTGDNSYSFADFWKYQQGTDSWTAVADLGAGYAGEITKEIFVIGDTAYACTGSFSNEFWAYEPVADVWIQKTDFAGIGRVEATGFSIDGKGYLGLGNANAQFGLLLNDFWQYEPSTNTWSSATAFDGPARENQPAFVINGKTYIISGESDNGALNDMWEFTPDSLTGINIIRNEFYFLISPNPSNGRFTLQSSEFGNVQLKIYSPFGQLIHHQIINQKSEIINLSSQPKGIYFIELTTNSKREAQKIIIQ